MRREDSRTPKAAPCTSVRPDAGRYLAAPASMRTLFYLCVILAHPLSAQRYVGVGADFGGIIREGNWADTYGPALVTGARVEVASARGWLIDLHGDLLYGNRVKIDPLAGLRTDVGILGDESDRARPVDIALRSRGFRVATLFGYQRVYGASNLGWRALVGPSYTVHNIRIQDDATLTTSNLRSDYKRGYDRRAGGWGGLGEFGGVLTQPDRQTTLFLTATVNVFRAVPLRSTQFDLQVQAPAPAIDVALGLKVGVVVALYRPTSREQAEEIYY